MHLALHVSFIRTVRGALRCSNVLIDQLNRSLGQNIALENVHRTIVT